VPKRRFDSNEILLGLVLPVLLAILVSVNFATGTVWGPAHEHSPEFFHAYTEPTIFFGFILMKIGLGAGLFVWHWLANRPHFDGYIIPLQLASLGIAALGLALVLAYVFA
jgi:hypothetical protein